ncbi:MAG: VWA domain-containing protein [Azoarcus sp.]|jgi:Ca-activated chloride channel family protein|nr:VWA domain-containing protein [Azoarcus sp.]
MKYKTALVRFSAMTALLLAGCADYSAAPEIQRSPPTSTPEPAHDSAQASPPPPNAVVSPAAELAPAASAPEMNKPAHAPAPEFEMAYRAAPEMARASNDLIIITREDKSFPPTFAENSERYGKISDNPVKRVAEEPVSTFSVDVDTGSYSNVRRMLTHGQLPPKDAVRVEEMINYFPYRYARPTDGKPFAVHTATAIAPWNADRVLLRVALKGEDMAKETLPPVNLVFLVDVSGSMFSNDKLPLLTASLKLLVNQMRKDDRISLVTYAGSTAVVLSGTPGSDKEKIRAALDRLNASGSTAGAAGIKLAYQEARKNFIRGGINRILLATDGDFNVGITDFDQLKQMIETERKNGVSFSTLGFGTGNYNEHLMEQLADAGNGAYSYIDSLMEGKKVLVNEMTSTLATIAKDVKIQIEFNPARVSEYRLIGYENRQLRREDFNNDKVDAGDIGAGHTVTALYELTLAGQKGAIDPLRYQPQAKPRDEAANSGELAFVKLRYKAPDGEQSTLIERKITHEASTSIDQADEDFRLAAAVAGFGQLLRGNADLGTWRYRDARALARNRGTHAADDALTDYRGELVKLIELAEALSGRQDEQD